MTRSEISRMTGLSEAAVSKIVASLIESNILTEGAFVKGIRGRRAIGVQIDNKTFRILSVHLSRRNFKIGKYDLSGNCEEAKVNEFKSAHAQEMLEQIVTEVKEELNRDSRYIALGIAVPGPYDMKTGTIMLMTEITGFYNINIKEVFESEFKLPVIITHDANAGALACFDENDEAVASNLVYYLVGQGVGAGVINDGSLILGNRGVAGEIGHVSVNHKGEQCKCGNRGCLELYCSSISIINRAIQSQAEFPDSQIFQSQKISIKHILDCADNQDELANKIIKDASYYIALGVMNIINTYNPELIIIGDELASASHYIQAELDTILTERGLSNIIETTSIIYAKPEVDYILKGAALNAIEESIINQY